MANFNVTKITAKDPESVIVGTTSATLVPFRYGRAGLTVVNISNNFVSLSFSGTAAIMYKGITLTPKGGAWSMDEYTNTNDIVYAVASGANSTICIQEYIDNGT